MNPEHIELLERMDGQVAEGRLPDFVWFSKFQEKETREQARELIRDLPEELWRFTYLDPDYGWCIKHYLIWEPLGFHWSPAQLCKRLALMKGQERDSIAAGNWGMAGIIVAGACRFDWVLEHEQEMRRDAFREELSSAWMHTEFPHSLDRRKVKAAFRRAGWLTDITGDVNDPSAPPKAPNPVTLYRGTTGRKGKDGLSWTAEPERAVWFAKRWSQGVEGTIDGGSGYVWEALVHPDRVLAYFGGRGEAEFVVDTTGLKMKEHRP